MSSDSNSHSFDTCPLRSSSLLIVHHERQVIVTASDEVFDMLGYHSDQLINQPLSLLSFSSRHGKKRQNAKARHAVTKQWVNLTICIHHDPFSTCSELDYCLLSPTDKQQHNENEQDQQTMATVTLLGLNSYGSIVHAYPSSQFPQSSPCHLVGRPIMSFIHTDDVRPLCRLLRKSSTSHHHHHHHHQHSGSSNSSSATGKLSASELVNDYTMAVRWLRSSVDTDQFEWMQMTVVNPTMYQHVPALNGRPICLLRPMMTPKSTCATVVDFFYATLESGRLYCAEFLHHLLACLIQLLHDLTSTHTIRQQRQQQQHIKVSDGVSVRLIPLISSIYSSSLAVSLNNDFTLSLLSFSMPTLFFSDRTLLDILKPILPQTNASSSSPL